jgi:hypothetical protein
VFERVRRVELPDGHTLVVQYEGEKYGWMSYIPGPHIPTAEQVVLARTPAKAMATVLSLPKGRPSAWMRELSARWEEELKNAPRYACKCCGHDTLLNPGRYEICAICRWEDDPAVERDGPDAHSGPNHLTLTEARANFARFGACDEKSKRNARSPRDDERRA